MKKKILKKKNGQRDVLRSLRRTPVTLCQRIPRRTIFVPLFQRPQAPLCTPVDVMLLGRRPTRLVCEGSNKKGNLCGQIQFKTTPASRVSGWHLQAKEQCVYNFLPAKWRPLLCKLLGCPVNVRTHQTDAPAARICKDGPEYGCTLHGGAVPFHLVAETQLCARQPQMALVKRSVGVH